MPFLYSHDSTGQRQPASGYLIHWARLAASRAAWMAGKSSPARTAMIEMTTRSSTRVKPERDPFVLVCEYFVIGFRQGKGWRQEWQVGETTCKRRRKRQVIPSIVSPHSTEACAKSTHNANDLSEASTQKRLQAKAMTFPRRGGACCFEFSHYLQPENRVEFGGMMDKTCELYQRFGNMQDSPRILTQFSIAHVVYHAYCENAKKRRPVVDRNWFAAGTPRTRCRPGRIGKGADGIDRMYSRFAESAHWRFSPAYCVE